MCAPSRASARLAAAVSQPSRPGRSRPSRRERGRARQHTARRRGRGCDPTTAPPSTGHGPARARDRPAVCKGAPSSAPSRRAACPAPAAYPGKGPRGSLRAGPWVILARLRVILSQAMGPPVRDGTRTAWIQALEALERRLVTQLEGPQVDRIGDRLPRERSSASYCLRSTTVQEGSHHELPYEVKNLLVEIVSSGLPSTPRRFRYASLSAPCSVPVAGHERTNGRVRHADSDSERPGRGSGTPAARPSSSSY